MFMLFKQHLYICRSGNFFTKQEKIVGKKETTNRTFTIPNISANSPLNDIDKPTTPQLKPPIKPDIKLLYCGII